MNKFVGTAAAMLLLSCGVWAAPTPAHARPPTFLFSPGYQARLEESRKAYADAWYAQQPATAPQASTPAPRRKKPHTQSQ